MRKPFPLATTVRGTGEPAVLLVPGWCGDRTVFDDLVAGLGSHRRAISVDLPGHGESTATHHDYTTGDVVDSLQAALEDAGVDRVVPVLLSHAGWAGIELRRRLDARVAGLVFLDWMVLGTPDGFADALSGLRSEAWMQVRAGLTAMWTHGVNNPRLSAYVASMSGYGQEYWARAGREIAAGFAEYPVPLDAVADLQPCPCCTCTRSPETTRYFRRRRTTPRRTPGSTSNAWTRSTSHVEDAGDGRTGSSTS